MVNTPVPWDVNPTCRVKLSLSSDLIIWYNCQSDNENRVSAHSRTHRQMELFIFNFALSAEAADEFVHEFSREIISTMRLNGIIFLIEIGSQWIYSGCFHIFEILKGIHKMKWTGDGKKSDIRWNTRKANRILAIVQEIWRNLLGQLSPNTHTKTKWTKRNAETCWQQQTPNALHSSLDILRATKYIVAPHKWTSLADTPMLHHFLTDIHVLIFFRFNCFAAPSARRQRGRGTLQALCVLLMRSYILRVLKMRVDRFIPAHYLAYEISPRQSSAYLLKWDSVVHMCVYELFGCELWVAYLQHKNDDDATINIYRSNADNNANETNTTKSGTAHPAVPCRGTLTEKLSHNNLVCLLTSNTPKLNTNTL